MTSGDPYLNHVVGVIAEHGYAVQYVGGDPTAGAHPFAYTVGLHKQPHRNYELAVSGLDADMSHRLLNTLAAALASDSLAPSDGLEVDGVLHDALDLRLRLVSRPEDLGIIHAIYGIVPPVWQAVWPDWCGRFPEDPQCRLSSQAQPLL